ncbi:MAG: ribonuclease Y, partial [Armatimonadota bacterium]
MTPEERIAQLEQQIKDLAGLSPAEARDQVLRQAEAELQDTLIRQRDHARAEAQDQARHLVLTAMERLAGSVPAPVTTSVVPLPNPDLKAKLVGRE